MNRISVITRRNLHSLIRRAYKQYAASNFVGEERNSGLLWHGALGEVDFLYRLYYLDEYPSSDPRFSNAKEDIVQHRVRNLDWDDCWVLDDERFGLLKGRDEELLDFITQMFHPVVREEDSTWRSYFEAINEIIKRDGYELHAVGDLSGYEIFGWEDVRAKTGSIVVTTDTPEFNTEYIIKQICSMEEAIADRPYDAIGKAKELVETCCKEIIIKCGASYDEKWEIPQLSQAARDVLNLMPNKVPEDKKARETIVSILGSLANIVQKIAELRNSYGSGHGKRAGFVGLGSRHARLASDAAKTFINFMWSTYLSREKSS